MCSIWLDAVVAACAFFIFTVNWSWTLCEKPDCSSARCFYFFFEICQSRAFYVQCSFLYYPHSTSIGCIYIMCQKPKEKHKQKMLMALFSEIRGIFGFLQHAWCTTWSFLLFSVCFVTKCTHDLLQLCLFGWCVAFFSSYSFFIWIPIFFFRCWILWQYIKQFSRRLCLLTTLTCSISRNDKENEIE